VRCGCGCGAGAVRVRVRCGCGAGAVRVRCGCGCAAAAVRLRCGCGAAAVRLRCGCGAAAAAAAGCGCGLECSLQSARVRRLQVRGLAMGVATLLNRLISGAIALSFLSLTRALTPTGTFASFAVIALLACAFIRRFIPETKGRALEEVEQEMLERLKIAPGPSSGANSGAAVELAASSRCV
jgi:hypothetical protein